MFSPTYILSFVPDVERPTMTSLAFLWGPIWGQRLGMPKDSFSALQAILLWIDRYVHFLPETIPVFQPSKSIFLSLFSSQRKKGFPYLLPKDSFQEDACPSLTSSLTTHPSRKFALYSVCSTLTSQVNWVLLQTNACFYTCCFQILPGCNFSDLSTCGFHHLSRSQDQLIYRAQCKLWGSLFKKYWKYQDCNRRALNPT